METIYESIAFGQTHLEFRVGRNATLICKGSVLKLWNACAPKAPQRCTVVVDKGPCGGKEYTDVTVPRTPEPMVTYRTNFFTLEHFPEFILDDLMDLLDKDIEGRLEVPLITGEVVTYCVVLTKDHGLGNASLNAITTRGCAVC